MSYLQVNIGRNIGDTPMSGLDWSRFSLEVQNALIDHRSALDLVMFRVSDLEVHEGLGLWGEENREESLHISGVFAEFPFAGYDYNGLRHTLRRIRKKYGQDAIALITDSELI